jgi:glutamate dehydrogenase (NAD(P)+)
MFHQRGVLCIPDFIANAGGVIAGAVEYGGGTARQAFETIEEKIRTNTREVLQRSKDAGIEPRRAAIEMARSRVKTMMSYRRAF